MLVGYQKKCFGKNLPIPLQAAPTCPLLFMAITAPMNSGYFPDTLSIA